MPEPNDNENKNKNLPKNLEPLLELYLSRTAEERYVDSLILLKQISQTVSKRRSRFNTIEDVKGESFAINHKDDSSSRMSLNLDEDEIKTLLSMDRSDGSDEKKTKFLYPIIDKIVCTYFGQDLNKNYKK